MKFLAQWMGAVVFTGLAAHAAPFTINVVMGGGLTTTQQAVFTTAANTWMGLLPSYQAGINIASLNINASGVAIDGAGGILGSAGPDTITNQGGFWLSTTGTMQFDTADLTNMENNGTLLAVILHEMAHVMGFGTLWNLNNVYTDGTGQYTGANAIAAYRTEYNQLLATFVPVELGGGPGTANGHWNENDGGGCCTGIISSNGDMTFDLMTGWLNGGSFISNTTVASFTDIGYMSAGAAIPEPGTFALFGAGLAIVGFHRRRR
ncbi:MAG: PEP-CTERM sorting domain-containing protein [Bryobacterales bacterium]|nr:PEP-CTERM sorting domain-containing protein [Bryobacterales bacterium]